MTTLVCSLLTAYPSLPSSLPVYRFKVLLYLDELSSLHFMPLILFALLPFIDLPSVESILA